MNNEKEKTRKGEKKSNYKRKYPRKFKKNRVRLLSGGQSYDCEERNRKKIVPQEKTAFVAFHLSSHMTCLPLFYLESS